MSTETQTPDPKIVQLCEEVQRRFPEATVGKELWYIVLLAALTTGPAPFPETASSLYLHLITLPPYQTPESRQALIRRLREVLVKLVSIIGVCKPLEAVFSIAKVEREEDKDFGSTREGWQCDEENDKRGKEWLGKIYKANIGVAENAMRGFADFDWISKKITYGLYLSDRQVLNDVETELVVLVGIMVQNLKLETHWHLRGTRRIGVSAEDVEKIQQCVEHIAAFMDLKLDRIPRVKDVESEV